MLHFYLNAGFYNWSHDHWAHLVNSIVDVDTFKRSMQETIHVAAQEFVSMLVSELFRAR